MNLLEYRDAGRRRSARRIAGALVAVAGLALCAYAGGQARRPADAPVPAKPAGPTLGAIRSRAASGRAAGKGPSANIGQAITLIGSGFDDNVSVQFTAFANSTFSILPLKVKGKRVSVAVPAQTATGAVRLVDPDSGTSAPLTLQVVPMIDTLSAASVAPGERLLIDGSGFTADAKVTFKGVATPVVPTVVSPTRVDIVVPVGAETGKITVVTAGGTSKPAKLTIAGAGTPPAPARPPVSVQTHRAGPKTTPPAPARAPAAGARRVPRR